MVRPKAETDAHKRRHYWQRLQATNSHGQTAVGRLKAIGDIDHVCSCHHAWILIPLRTFTVVAIGDGPRPFADTHACYPSELHMRFVAECVKCWIDADLAFVPCLPVQPRSNFHGPPSAKHGESGFDQQLDAQYRMVMPTPLVV